MHCSTSCRLLLHCVVVLYDMLVVSLVQSVQASAYTLVMPSAIVCYFAAAWPVLICTLTTLSTYTS
jgi:hypothetical protein